MISVSLNMLRRVPSFVLVDDDDDDRMLMKMALIDNKSEFPIQEFANGQELLNYLNNELQSHDDDQIHWLVIMDINMPIMNGPDALRQMQEHPLWKQVPVMMMSTSDDPILAKEMIALGAKAYVVKPKTYKGLVNQIQTTFYPWLKEHVQKVHP